LGGFRPESMPNNCSVIFAHTVKAAMKEVAGESLIYRLLSAVFNSGLGS
jgi:hypothetical protein